MTLTVPVLLLWTLGIAGGVIVLSGLIVVGIFAFVGCGLLRGCTGDRH
jgi:hypothetical protein